MTTLNGLEGIVVAETHISDVDGERGELVIAGAGVERLAADVDFATSPEALAGAGLVVVTVKGPATAQAAAQIAAHAPAEAAALSLQNGISHIDTLRTALPGRKVLRGIGMIEAHQEPEGERMLQFHILRRPD